MVLWKFCFFMVEAAPDDSRKNVWLYAGMLGSIWASVEILIGSFLHNLHIPLTGTFLSLLSVFLISAASQVWPAKGMIWRSALVAASMKAVSPSAVILGPMMAIVMEGFLFEISLAITRRHIAGFIISGAIAASWSIVQRLINLVLVYGFNLVELYRNLYRYAADKMGFVRLPGDEYFLVIAFIALPFLGGMVFSAAGIWIGRRSLKKEDTCTEGQNVIPLKKNYSKIPHSRPSLLMGLIQMFLIVFGLYFIETSFILYGFLYTVAYIGFNLYRYKNLTRKFKKPGMYVTFILLAFLTGFFLGGGNATSRDAFTLEGAYIGGKMIFRAFIMIIGFSVIGMELKHEKIRHFFHRLGFARLQPSLEVAFLAMPFMSGILVESARRTKNPFKVAICMLVSARKWIARYSSVPEACTRVTIITGSLHSGKTTLALAVNDILKSEQISTYGFLTPGYMKNGQRTGFDILSARTGEKTAFAIKGIGGDAVRTGRFSFYESGFRFGRQCLEMPAIPEKSVVFIDEIGPLELTGKGWDPCVRPALERSGASILVIRRNILEEAISRYAIQNPEIVDVDLFQEDPGPDGTTPKEKAAQDIAEKMLKCLGRPVASTIISGKD